MLLLVQRRPRRAQVADLSERELVQLEITEGFERIGDRTAAAVERIPDVRPVRVDGVEIDDAGRIGKAING